MAMSPPAQKCPPSPVNSTACTASSENKAGSSAISVLRTSWLSAFRLSGRFIATRAIPSARRSTLTAATSDPFGPARRALRPWNRSTGALSRFHPYRASAARGTAPPGVPSAVRFVRQATPAGRLFRPCRGSAARRRVSKSTEKSSVLRLQPARPVFAKGAVAFGKPRRTWCLPPTLERAAIVRAKAQSIDHDGFLSNRHSRGSATPRTRRSTHPGYGSWRARRAARQTRERSWRRRSQLLSPTRLP